MEMEVQKTLTLILSQDEARLVAAHCIHAPCPFRVHDGCPFLHQPCRETDHPACYKLGEAIHKALEG